jgi:hypothetical protein
VDRRSQSLRDGDRQHDLRHGEENVRHAHQQIAEPIVVIAGDQPDRHADQHGGRGRDHGDQDGQPRAEQQPAENIPPIRSVPKKLTALGPSNLRGR